MLDYLVLDIECSKKPLFKPWHTDAFLSSIGVSSGDKYSSWFFNPEIGNASKHLKDIQKFFNKTDTLVGHNLKFDLLWLIHCGLELPQNIWCTQIAEYLLNGQHKDVKLSLNELAARYGLGSKVDEMKEYWDDGYNTDEIPIDIHKKYLEQDVKLTQQIYLIQKDLIEKADLTELMDLTCQLSKVLAYAECTGIPLDEKAAHEIICDGSKQRIDLEEEMKGIVGVDFNPSSTAQLGAVLYGGIIVRDGRETYSVTLKSGVVKEKSRKCKIEEEVKGLGFAVDESKVSLKTGKPSTNADSVGSLVATTDKQKLFLSTLIKYRNLDKMLSTLISKSGSGWLNSVAKDGRLHSNFNQTVTVTGRLSSTEPNAQNIPRGNTSPLKYCIKPKDKDYLIVNLDLAQIEWRQAAELSRDKVMLQELYEGVDIHSNNAVALFGVKLEDKDSADKEKKEAFKIARQSSKTVSFRLLYGGNAYGFFMDSNMPNLSLDEWEKVVDNFYKKYKGLKKWQEKNYKEVLEKGYMRTISKRIFSFKGEDLGSTQVRKDIKRKCSNFPVQGSSADVINCCVVELFNSEEYKNTRSSIILLVHDSIVMEIHKDDVAVVAKKVLDIFKNIPTLFEKRFGYQYVTPIFGDCEIGLNYKDVISCDENTIDEVVKSLTEQEK